MQREPAGASILARAFARHPVVCAAWLESRDESYWPHVTRFARTCRIATAVVAALLAWLCLARTGITPLAFRASHEPLALILPATWSGLLSAKARERFERTRLRSWLASLPIATPTRITASMLQASAAVALRTQLSGILLLTANLLIATSVTGGEGRALVQLAGHDLLASPLAAKQHLGYAVAPDCLPGVLNGWQCLQVHAAAKRMGGIDAESLALANTLGLTPWLANPVATYSFGTRQKLSLLLALLGDPASIALDESLSDPDPAAAMVAKQYLQARVSRGHAGIFLATHALDLPEYYADRTALRVEGRLLRAWHSAELVWLRKNEGLAAALAAAVAH
ncbi:MAG: hypothetical protein WBW61_02070 [Rhodanobacteraceae bacterium]